jgi:hypothetical protein
MPQLVADCPRCKASKVAFEAKSSHYVGCQSGWVNFYDTFCVCSHCNQTVTFILKLRDYDERNSEPQKFVSVNGAFDVHDFRSLKDQVGASPPDHLPPSIEAAFKEGAACLAVKCYNAGATMFRMCLDIATKELLPEPMPAGLTPHIQRNLGPRLGWLFDNGILPEPLRELSQCIKDDGNAGAHDGSLIQVDAADLMDFTFILLERLYTEPKRLELAAQRRASRHSPPSP